jgi:hypothetical protein
MDAFTRADPAKINPGHAAASEDLEATVASLDQITTYKREKKETLFIHEWEGLNGICQV